MNNLARHSGALPRLLGAGQFKMAQNKASAPHIHKMWLLEIITDGQLEICFQDGPWLSLPARSGVLCAPLCSYREKTPLRSRACHSVGLLFETQMPLRFDAPFFLVHDAENVLLESAEKILHHLGLGAADDLLASSAFFKLMAHLLQAEISNGALLVGREYSRPGDMIAQTHRFMRAHLAQKISLQQLADHVGLSVSGFAHAYKRKAGVSPMTTLRQMRVETAKFSLLRERTSLAQIARETGFADAFHLSRAFKQTVGESPRRFHANRIK